jgi:hypothetical protein
MHYTTAAAARCFGELCLSNLRLVLLFLVVLHSSATMELQRLRSGQHTQQQQEQEQQSGRHSPRQQAAGAAMSPQHSSGSVTQQQGNQRPAQGGNTVEEGADSSR